MWGWRQWPGEGWPLYVWLFLCQELPVFYYQRHFDFSFHKANCHLGHCGRTVSQVSKSRLESYANTEIFLFFPFKYTCICGILKHVILAYNKSAKSCNQSNSAASKKDFTRKIEIQRHWKPLEMSTEKDQPVKAVAAPVVYLYEYVICFLSNTLHVLKKIRMFSH